MSDRAVFSYCLDPKPIDVVRLSNSPNWELRFEAHHETKKATERYLGIELSLDQLIELHAKIAEKLKSRAERADELEKLNKAYYSSKASNLSSDEQDKLANALSVQLG